MSRQDKILQHLTDIDFRSREERQKDWKAEFIDWYETLTARQELAYSDHVQGQLAMLSAVLWHLLPPTEYRALIKRKSKKSARVQAA